MDSLFGLFWNPLTFRMKPIRVPPLCRVGEGVGLKVTIDNINNWGEGKVPARSILHFKRTVGSCPQSVGNILKKFKIPIILSMFILGLVKLG